MGRDRKQVYNRKEAKKMSKLGREPAFPIINECPGITQRLLLTGIIASGLCAVNDKGTFSSKQESIERICELSIQIVDELLKREAL